MIPSEEEGLLRELNVKEGDAVPSGKIIGRIDDSRLQMESKRGRKKLAIQMKKAGSKSAYNVARKKYDLAKEEHDVSVRLGKKGSKSSSEVRRARYSMEASYAEVEAAMDQRSEAAGLAELEEINLEQINMMIGKMRISSNILVNTFRRVKTLCGLFVWTNSGWKAPFHQRPADLRMSKANASLSLSNRPAAKNSNSWDRSLPARWS